MKSVKINKVDLGEGRPKVIVPIVERSREKIIEAAKGLCESTCDMIEWRLDFFEGVTDSQRAADLSQELKKHVKKPLLLTFRSQREGGNLAFSDEQYVALSHALISRGAGDLLDVERFMPMRAVNELIDAAHDKGLKILLSSHDFHRTPSKETIIQRLIQMQKLNADICKIAVMPQNTKDVLTLLQATEEMVRLHADRPIITMSMGELGKISRVTGGLFGSAATFGSAGQVSAPGQLPVEQLGEMLDFFSAADQF